MLRPRSEGLSKRPTKLRWLTPMWLYQHNRPLFADLEDELYLSPEVKYKRTLELLGLRSISDREGIARIEADLDSPSSRMKSPATTDDWHTRSAQLIMTLFKKNRGFSKDILGMSLIPLTSGFWSSTEEAPVFYPETGKIQIPPDLGLRLVDPDALRNGSRDDLFSTLGVQNCPSMFVVGKILLRYGRFCRVSLETSVMHLRYLYCYLPRDDVNLTILVYLKDQARNPVYRKFVPFGAPVDLAGDDLYFETEDEYGPKELLKAIPQTDGGRKVSAPGFAARYINSAYLKVETLESCRHDLGWEEWLHIFVGVRWIPRLSWPSKKSKPPRLSELFLYVIENRSEKVVGTLKAHWSSYKGLMVPEIVKTAIVPCENGEYRQLRKTYLPLPSLMRSCRKRGIGRALPFLKLPIELDERNGHEWRFLQTSGVVCKKNLDLYLECLWQLVYANQDLEDIPSGFLSNLIKIYESIKEHSSSKDHRRIRYIILLSLPLCS